MSDERDDDLASQLADLFFRSHGTDSVFGIMRRVISDVRAHDAKHGAIPILTIEPGGNGLYHAVSRELGLFISSEDIEELKARIPEVLAAMPSACPAGGGSGDMALVPREPSVYMAGRGAEALDIRPSEARKVYGDMLVAHERETAAEPPAFPVGTYTAVRNAASDVTRERLRQIEVEGWTPEHDDEHCHGELAGAAATYAAHRSHVPLEIVMGEDLMQMLWPFSPAWLKPTNRRRDLVKAGALILAEIERLDRLAAAEPPARSGEEADHG